jgi:hypothetical protein
MILSVPPTAGARAILHNEVSTIQDINLDLAANRKRVHCRPSGRQFVLAK